MNDLVSKKIIAEFVGWISLDEEAASKVNSAAPGF